MNDLIFITHCCFTSHKSLQMEITADNINVSSDEPQTFFYVFSMLANLIMKLKQIAGRSLINRETQEYSEWKRLYSECRAIAQLMISECLANVERLQSEWIANAIRA